jgi:predicted regulator of Ras-like GTPase activity (Roadblock/LC7/MglB family)
MKLLNIDETNAFLRQLTTDRNFTSAFICTPEGGLIAASDFSSLRMVVEALSTVWQSLLPRQWKRTSFQWTESYVVLINCGDWVFGVEQRDPNPLALGLLHLKAKACAEHIKQQLE